MLQKMQDVVVFLRLRYHILRENLVFVRKWLIGISGGCVDEECTKLLQQSVVGGY